MTDTPSGTDSELLSAYLASKGWRPTELADSRRVIWADTEGARIFVPKRSGADSSELMDHAVAKLADQESRSVAEVTADLAWSSFDKLAVRRETAALSSLAFDDGIELHKASYNLIIASAMASRERRGSFVGGRSSYVKRYVDSVRMIPSVPGSFVVRALLPLQVQELESQYEELQLEGFADSPNGRPASMMILKATEAAVETANRLSAGEAELEEWDASVDSGVSSNLCDALVALTGHEQGGDVALSIDWTWSAASPGTETEVLVPRRLSPFLSAGSEYLKSDKSVEVIEMVGLITNLHRESSSGPGEVTLKGAVKGDRNRSIRFELDEQSYRDALAAHEAGDIMTLTAEVRREGRGLIVNSVIRLAPHNGQSS